MAANTPTEVQFQELLECTICLDVPASPIMNCENGHIVCGICSEKVVQCGLCQTALQVSTLGERLSRQLDLKAKCPNYDVGCGKIIAASVMKDHFSKCYYRNVICDQWRNGYCNSSIPLKDFARHAGDRHGCVINQSSPICRRLYFFQELNDGTNWPLSFILKDEKTFVNHSYVNNDVVHFWTTLLGDKDETEKYSSEMSVEKKVNENKKIKCSWTLPVLPFHDHSRFKAAASSLYVGIPMANFREFSTKEEESKYPYTFVTTLTVTAV